MKLAVGASSVGIDRAYIFVCSHDRPCIIMYLCKQKNNTKPISTEFYLEVERCSS